MLSSKLPLSVFVGRTGNNLLNKATAAGISSISFGRRSIATTKMVQIKVSSFSILPKIRINKIKQRIGKFPDWRNNRINHNIIDLQSNTEFSTEKSNPFTSVPTFCNIFRLRNDFEGNIFRIYIIFVCFHF